ncbi:MAG: hypothetical protein L6R43_11650, partial [Planctomycetes bacterium]|nr:hypothetical protein [Planctomycetota bacterium]
MSRRRRRRLLRGRAFAGLTAPAASSRRCRSRHGRASRASQARAMRASVSFHRSAGVMRRWRAIRSGGSADPVQRGG